MDLFQEIQSKCTAEEIANRNYHIIASKVNEGRTKITSRLISERGILESYPDGPLAADVVLAKLEAFASAGHPLSSIVDRALKFLGQSSGLDIGSAATQLMVTQLGAGGVLTVDEANKLKALAPTVNDHVTWEQCQAALEGN